MIGAAGAYFYRARYYDPQQARFLSQDPLGLAGGDTNLYRYAANNPIQISDPNGELAWFAIPIIWGAIEIGLSIYDAYDTASTLADSCKTAGEKWLAGGLFMLGAVLPGGGYSAADDIITSKPVKEGIYEFVDTTGKKYVGQSSDISQRLQQHIDSGKLNPGKHVDVNPMPGSTKTQREIAEHRRIQEITGGVPARSRTRCRTSEIPSDPSDNICSMIPRKQVDGGFIIEQEHLPGSCYVLTDSWQPRYEEVMVREGVRYLRLNRTLGARYENLEFLRALGFLRGVEIYDWDVKELAPLLALRQLELLGLQCQFKNIDFAAHFPRLQLASFTWRPGSESFLTCRTLAFLFVEGYPFEDLTPLSKLGALRRLHVNSRQLVRASGAEQLLELKHLTFAFCSALSDIEDLARCQAIEVLEFNCCKKLAELSPLSALKRLRRLLIENGAQIASIKPLRHDEALEEVYLPGTKIGDGDLRPLLDLPNLRRVAFPKSRKHSHTMDQINAALARRGQGI